MQLCGTDLGNASGTACSPRSSASASNLQNIVNEYLGIKDWGGRHSSRLRGRGSGREHVDRQELQFNATVATGDILLYNCQPIRWRLLMAD